MPRDYHRCDSTARRAHVAGSKSGGAARAHVLHSSARCLELPPTISIHMKSLLAASLLASATIAVAQTPSTSPNGASWMRYPAISPDGKTIAFTFKGDIYKVSSAGGTATPLTTHTANDYAPVWSHDGKQIAFASDRYGNYDIYVISADGGEAKRLTFHSANETPYTFTSDDKDVIFGAARQDAAANRQYPTGAQPELYVVPAAGGRPIQI